METHCFGFAAATSPAHRRSDVRVPPFSRRCAGGWEVVGEVGRRLGACAGCSRRARGGEASQLLNSPRPSPNPSERTRAARLWCAAARAELFPSPARSSEPALQLWQPHPPRVRTLGSPRIGLRHGRRKRGRCSLYSFAGYFCYNLPFLLSFDNSFGLFWPLLRLKRLTGR